MRAILLSAWIVFAVCVIGCTPSNPPAKKGGDSGVPKKNNENELGDEAQVKQAFSRLKAAIAAKSGDAIWDLVDKDTQTDADREAKAVKATYAKRDDKGKKAYEEQMKLDAKELADMTGKLYLQSQRFYGKHHEIPDSRVEKVTVTGDAAALVFVEPDDDKVTLRLTRDPGEGQLRPWKVSLQVPKAPE